MGRGSVVMGRLPTEVVPDLEWVKASVGHELRGGGSVYAELRFKSRFKYRTVAFAQTVDSRWEFCQKNWLESDVIVRNEGQDEIVATMTLDGKWAGILVRPEDRRMITTLRWSNFGTWDTEDDWVIRYHNTSGFNTFQARIEVNAGIVHLSELPLLITLGWYMKVLRYRSQRSALFLAP